jgi:uncharacterized protein YbbC (DUF1343 family)
MSFQIAAAPWLRAPELISILNEMKIPGIELEIMNLIPSDNKYQGIHCEGIRLEVTETKKYKPIATGLKILAAIKTLYPDHFTWNEYPTLANPSGKNHFNKLIGDEDVLNWIEQDPLDHLDDLDFLLKANGWTERCSSIILYE